MTVTALGLPVGLPGDFALRWRGRVYRFPFATTVLLSLILWLVSRLV